MLSSSGVSWITTTSCGTSTTVRSIFSISRRLTPSLRTGSRIDSLTGDDTSLGITELLNDRADSGQVLVGHRERRRQPERLAAHLGAAGKGVVGLAIGG